MKLKFHHVGIAVKQIDDISRLLHDKLGISFDEPEEVEQQKVRVTFSNDSTGVELVEATQARSPQFPVLQHPVLSFIDSKGEGLHHLCFEVDNIEEAFGKLTHDGVKILGKAIQTGSKGKRIFFIDPTETAGVLIEIKEEKKQA